MTKTNLSPEARYTRLTNRLKTEVATAYVAFPVFIGGVIGRELGVDIPKPIIAISALIGMASIVGFVDDNQSLRFHNPLEDRPTPDSNLEL